jgi:tellurite resistance protein
LRELINRGQLTADTYVYNDSPEDAPKGWQLARDTEIAALLKVNVPSEASEENIENRAREDSHTDIKEILKTVEARRDFLIGLVSFAKGNGVVDENELMFFQQAAVALELDQKSLDAVNASWSSGEKPMLNFTTDIEKRFFLREAVQLSNIDGSYDEPEQELAKGYAKELNIPEAELKAIEKWVADGIEWQAAGERLVWGE